MLRRMLPLVALLAACASTGTSSVPVPLTIPVETNSVFLPTTTTPTTIPADPFGYHPPAKDIAFDCAPPAFQAVTQDGNGGWQVSVLPEAGPVIDCMFQYVGGAASAQRFVDSGCGSLGPDEITYGDLTASWRMEFLTCMLSLTDS